MSQAININAASAAELAEVLGMSMSKAVQIVQKRLHAHGHYFSSPNSFARKCSMGVDHYKMQKKSRKVGEPGVGILWASRGSGNAKVEGDATAQYLLRLGMGELRSMKSRGVINLIQGQGAVGYGNLLTPGETPMQPKSALVHRASYSHQTPQSLIPHGDPALTELKRTHSVDRLNYVPPVPPRALLSGTSAEVQTSPEVFTGEGVIGVETQGIQTSPGLMAGDEDPEVQRERQLATERIRVLEQQLADKECCVSGTTKSGSCVFSFTEGDGAQERRGIRSASASCSQA